MRYMSFVIADPNQGPPPQALQDAMGPYVQQALQSGTLIDTGGLDESAHAITVRIDNRSITVHDGPFSEAKEVIGGYALMRFDTREQAIDAGKDFLALHAKHWPEWRGSCEIRQVFGMED